MVIVKIKGCKLHFKPIGWHIIWSLKREIIVDIEQITDVRVNGGTIQTPRGIKLPGTYLPGVIIAGTYYWKGQRVFWDVMVRRESIIVDLKNHRYEQLVFNVAHPAETVSLIKGALGEMTD